MGKYVNGGDSPVTFAPGAAACPSSQATGFDAASGACFKIYGIGVLITPTSASIQAGFEVFNFNVHRDGTQRPVVNPSQLEGMVS